MKRIRLAGWAVLVVAGGLLTGCQKNQHQGPYYSGWGGCYSHTEPVHGGADGFPTVSPDGGGHPVWTPPPGGTGAR